MSTKKLSLHITQYENLMEDDIALVDLMEFKGLEKLLNPNDSSASTPPTSNQFARNNIATNVQSFIHETYAFQTPVSADCAPPTFVPSDYVWDRLSKTGIENAFKKRTVEEMDREALAFLTANVETIFVTPPRGDEKLISSVDYLFMGADDDDFFCLKSNISGRRMAVKLFSKDKALLQFHPVSFILQPGEVKAIRVWKLPKCPVTTHFDVAYREAAGELKDAKNAFLTMDGVEFLTIYIEDKLRVPKAPPVAFDKKEIVLAVGESKSLNIKKNGEDKYAVKAMVDEQFAKSYDVVPAIILIESEKTKMITVTRKSSTPCDASLTLKLVEVTNYSLAIDDVDFFAKNPEVVIALKCG